LRRFFVSFIRMGFAGMKTQSPSFSYDLPVDD
jgi:hypothetical protein